MPFLRFYGRAREPLFRSCGWRSPLVETRLEARQYATSGAPASSKQCLDLSSPANDFIRMRGDPARLAMIEPDSLQLWPDFLDKQEQSLLLSASLKKLDNATGSREERKRRRAWLKTLRPEDDAAGRSLPLDPIH